MTKEKEEDIRALLQKLEIALRDDWRDKQARLFELVDKAWVTEPKGITPKMRAESEVDESEASEECDEAFKRWKQVRQWIFEFEREASRR